jgi:serine protease AprX
MRALAAIALLILGALVAAPGAAASPAQDAYGVTQARSDAPALDGDGLVVAVIDTGVDGTHPALADRVIASVDLSAPPSMPCPDFGHGTWVASIIAGVATSQLSAGVAPEAEIVSVKVVNNCHESSLQRIADGIDWVLDHPEYGIDVVNLSIGDKTPSGPDTDVAEAAVDRAVEHGLTVVTAAGNEPGLGMVATPASAERAITVGSMTDPWALSDGLGFRASPFTSSGPTAEARVKPDVMGPPANTGAASGGGAATHGGTSGAAAFVSGVALLMLDANPGLGPRSVKERLMATAHDWGRPGIDEDYGAGRLDAYAALQAAGAPLATPPATPAHRTFPGRAAPGAPVVHQVVVTDAGTPLVATLFPDPPDRLPAGAPVELDLRLQGPGVDEQALTTYRQRSLALASPVPGTYTLTVSAAAGAASYALDVSGALEAAGGPPALAQQPPATSTNDATPTFTGHSGSAAGVAVRVYRNGAQVRSLWALPAVGGGWSAEPATGLPDGTYQVGAEQGSAGGVPGRTARATFTVDTAAPDTALSQSGTTFTFSSEPGARFECSDDEGPWTACASPLSRAGQPPGTHSLAVQAVDRAGNADPTPASASWTVPAPPPQEQLWAPPADTQAPELTLAGALARKLSLLRGGGLLVPVRCDEACTLRAELQLASRPAQRLHLPVRLAKAAGELAGAGAYDLRLRPSRANRARLRRVRSLKLTIVVVATDAAGNEDRLSRSLKLR